MHDTENDNTVNTPSGIKFKICTKCMVLKDVNEFYLIKEGRWKGSCKECHKKKCKENYQIKRDSRIEYQKKYYEEHKEARREYGRKYYEKNKVKINATTKKNRDKTRAEWRANRERHKKYLKKIMAGDKNAVY